MTACEVAADPTSKDLCHTDPVKYVSDSSAEYHLPTYQKKKTHPTDVKIKATHLLFTNELLKDI